MPDPHYNIPASLPCDAPGSLLSATRKLIEKDGEHRSRTALAAALGIPLHWLNAFVRGDIESPSVNRIQYIYDRLSSTKLKV